MQGTGTVLFVVNPIAGGNDKSRWEQAIRDYFDTLPITIDFFFQTGGNDIPAIRERINQTNPEKVVAVGGDGTVKMVAEAIKESKQILGIIPAGSANGLAKELGIPTDINGALQIIVDGKEGKLDAIRINEKELCFHLSDAGLNALVVKYFEASNTRGMWGYAKALVKMLWNKRKMRVSIKTDTQSLKHKAYMVALANAERYGTGAVINPDGDVSDGCFEIVIVRKINVVEVWKAITARKRFDSKKIEVIRTKSVELSFHNKAPFQVDGEYLGRITHVNARIQPGLVRLMIPNESS